MKRIDPYKREETYKRWKSETGGKITNVPEADAGLIERYLRDMELGLNVARASSRGPRSFARLNTLRMRIPTLARKFSERFGTASLTEVTEEQALTLFSELRQGIILKENGQPYQSVADFVKDFRSFWHWHMESQRKEGVTVPDVAIYLDAGKQKPRWVYLTLDEVKRLCSEAKYEYRVLMMFLLDTGMRSPSELVNIRVADFYDDFTKVHIRDEVSKTFGRRINLMLCAGLIRELVRVKGMEPHDAVFPISPAVANRYLKRLATRVLGDAATLAGDKYSALTLYDFRHISACYWLPRYKSESALKYRFGWKKTERIHYYTELLGMRDTITEDDLVMDVEKTALEQRLESAERDKQVLHERLDAMQHQMAKIAQVTERLLAQAAPLTS